MPFDIIGHSLESGTTLERRPAIERPPRPDRAERSDRSQRDQQRDRDQQPRTERPERSQRSQKPQRSDGSDDKRTAEPCDGDTGERDFRSVLDGQPDGAEAVVDAPISLAPEPETPTSGLTAGLELLSAAPGEGEELAVTLVLPSALTGPVAGQVAVEVADPNASQAMATAGLTGTQADANAPTGAVSAAALAALADAPATAAAASQGLHTQQRVPVMVAGETVEAELHVVTLPRGPGANDGDGSQIQAAVNPATATTGQAEGDETAATSTIDGDKLLARSAAPTLPGDGTPGAKRPATQPSPGDLAQAAAGQSQMETEMAMAAQPAHAGSGMQMGQGQHGFNDPGGTTAITGLTPVHQAANQVPQTFGVAQPAQATPQQALAQGDETLDRTVQHQVRRAIVQQLANGDRTLTLRLTPPDLGTVRIELVESRGLMTVRFHAEDDGVRTALERQLPSLRQDLRAADAPIAQMRMGDGSAAWHQGQTQHDQGAQGQHGQHHDSPRFSLDGEPEREADSITTHRSELGGTISEERVDARA